MHQLMRLDCMQSGTPATDILCQLSNHNNACAWDELSAVEIHADESCGLLRSQVSDCQSKSQ